MISLKLAKKHLNIDQEFTDDDSLIMAYISVAEKAVIADLDLASEDDVYDDNGDYKDMYLQSVLLLVGNLYANRESATYGAPTIVPYAFQWLQDLQRDYTHKTYSTDSSLS